MAAVHDDEAGFWPGYVAAVSGLVQGLLIMAMALATAIFALGEAARRTPPAGGGQAAAPAPIEASVPFVAPPRAALLPLPAPVPDAAGEAGPAATVPPVAGATAHIAAGFQGDAVILPASAVPGLLQGLYRARGIGVDRWRITIPARIDDPRDQRAAYLRLIGLRALLVKNGISPGAVDLWIENSAEPAGSARTARIEPLDANGAPLPGAPTAGEGDGR